MRDWKKIINQYRDEGFLTDKQAEDLQVQFETLVEHGLDETKLAGFIGKARQAAVGKIQTGLKWLSEENRGQSLMSIALAGAIVADPIAATGRAIINPIAAGREYKAMRVELDARFPDIATSTPEKDIQAVYHVVRSTAPYLAQNPILAAAATREAIDLPTSMGLDVVKRMVEIQGGVNKNLQSSTLLGVGVGAAARAGAEQAITHSAKSTAVSLADRLAGVGDEKTVS